MRIRFVGMALIVLCGRAMAEDLQTPRPVPLTRPELKRALEDMKTRTPRIPLPELTEADKEQLGERGSSYESRLRYHYLPESPGGSASGSGFFGIGRSRDPEMTLDYGFTVELFWIASRTNNCQY